MPVDHGGDPLWEMFIADTAQNVRQLKRLILHTQKEGRFTRDVIYEIFRIVHTIKGSAAMMSLPHISLTAHKMEDFFHYMLEHDAAVYDPRPVSDLVLAGAAYFRRELKELQGGGHAAAGECICLLSAVFLGMRRIVDDMGKALGKDVRLELRGEETDVDQTILAHILDSLIHLVRNCVDHGVENREERLQANKPQTATITLEARQAKDQLWIIVRDDGRGLDEYRILQRAKEKKLLREDVQNLCDTDMCRLIFLPGFSTKQAATEFSGRGMGMDAVLQSISAIGGTVTVDSRPGQGMTVSMMIPRTIKEENKTP